MTLVTIPNRPAGSDQRQIALLLADFDAITTVVNGQLDGQNVVASLTGRRLVGQASAFVPPGQAGGWYFMTQSGFLGGAGASLNLANECWYLDPANFAVVGKANTQMILRMQIVTGVAPAVTIQGQLNAVTSPVAGAGLVGLSQGSLVGSAAGIAAPGAGTITVAESTGGAFAMPAAGAYAPFINLSGATAANSAMSILMQLFALNS